MNKLEKLHSCFIVYSSKFADLYQNYIKLEHKEVNKSRVKWLRKNMHYQHFVKDLNFSEEPDVFSTKESVKIIPKTFKEFIKQDLHIGETN